MSTQINITVGSGGLSDRAMQQQQAARQAQLERERQQRIEAQGTEQRNAKLQAEGKAPDGSALYSVNANLPQIERRPAAFRTTMDEVCSFWLLNGETVTVYSGDGKTSASASFPNLTNPFTPKYNTSGSSYSTTTETGSTSALTSSMSPLIPTATPVYIYPVKNEIWYMNNGPIDPFDWPAVPGGYIGRYDPLTTSRGDASVREQINAYSSRTTYVTERSFVNSFSNGAELLLPVGKSSCLYVLCIKYKWSCTDARFENERVIRTVPLGLQESYSLGSYGLYDPYDRTVYDTWAYEATVNQKQRTADTQVADTTQIACFFVTNTSVKQVDVPAALQAWIEDYMNNDTAGTPITFSPNNSIFSVVENIEAQLYEKPYVEQPYQVSQNIYDTGLIPSQYWNREIWMYAGNTANKYDLQIEPISISRYPNGRVNALGFFNYVATASYGFPIYGGSTPLMYELLKKNKSFITSNASVIASGTVAQLNALFGKPELPKEISILPCVPADICTTDTTAYGFIPTVYNYYDYPGIASSEFRRYTGSMRYQNPGGNIFRAWNWGATTYCRTQAKALGFTDADLTP